MFYSDGTVKEWDIKTMTCVRSLHDHTASVNCVQVLYVRKPARECLVNIHVQPQAPVLPRLSANPIQHIPCTYVMFIKWFEYLIEWFILICRQMMIWKESFLWGKINWYACGTLNQKRLSLDPNTRHQNPLITHNT